MAVPDASTDIDDLIYFLRMFEGGYSVTSEPVRFGWRGYLWDGKLNLHHVRHRVFDPKLMTWLQPDPLGTIDGPNIYAYAGWDPFNKIDPYGLAADIGYVQAFLEGEQYIVDVATGDAAKEDERYAKLTMQTTQMQQRNAEQAALNADSCEEAQRIMKRFDQHAMFMNADLQHYQQVMGVAEELRQHLGREIRNTVVGAAVGGALARVGSYLLAPVARAGWGLIANTAVGRGLSKVWQVANTPIGRLPASCSADRGQTQARKW